MQPFKKILFATDFSDCATHAQAYAFAFATRFNAELEIVHAVDPSSLSYPGVYGFVVEVERHVAAIKLQARQELAAVARLAQDQGVSKVHTQVLDGRVAEAIVDEAQRQGSDLLIVGTHGRSGFQHFLFGSNAERVVRYSTIPVLAIKAVEREFLDRNNTLRIKHVLCPCDLSPLAEQAADSAAEICRVFGAELTLLHVIDLRFQHPLVAPDPEIFNSEYMRKHALERLTAIAARFKDVNVHVEVITGIPDRLIAEAARDRSVDLIAMTTHGLGGLSRALLGSTAEKIVRTAQVPTMSIRPGNQNANLSSVNQ